MRSLFAVVAASLALLAALALPGASWAVGPSLPALQNTDITSPSSAVSYRPERAASATRVQKRARGRMVGSLTLPGGWGIQLATIGGALTGLSPNGRVLVLGDNVQPTGLLRARSRFAVVDTTTLTLRKTISLRGDFSVDALSPDGSLLYLIHHVSGQDVTKYQVQAYDLRAGLLIPGVVADKSQAGWTMAGYPVARVASRSGAWVYTLYRQNDNYPFIHALDTAHRTAICVGLPAHWTTENAWIDSARLVLHGTLLLVEKRSGEVRYRLDTTNFQLSLP